LPFEGGAGLPPNHLTQCSLGQGLPMYQVASSIQPFGHNTPTLQTGRQTDNEWSDRIGETVFGRLFVKRFVSYRTIVLSCPVCLSVLSVCNVGVL